MVCGVNTWQSHTYHKKFRTFHTLTFSVMSCSGDDGTNPSLSSYAAQGHPGIGIESMCTTKMPTLWMREGETHGRLMASIVQEACAHSKCQARSSGKGQQQEDAGITELAPHVAQRKRHVEPPHLHKVVALSICVLQVVFEAREEGWCTMMACMATRRDSPKPAAKRPKIISQNSRWYPPIVNVAVPATMIDDMSMLVLPCGPSQEKAIW